MDKDRLNGIGKHVSGSLKEAVGKVTGDTEVQIEGAAEKKAGRAENSAGVAEDAGRK